MLDRVLQQPALQEIDIVKKCKKYPDFRKQLLDIQKVYLSDLNMSLYCNLEEAEKKGSVDVMKRDKLYVNFYGFKMGTKDEELKKIFLFWINKMDELFRENLSRKYTIIYYHSITDSNTPFSYLKDAFKKLPIQYYALLDKFYVVQPNFLIRNANLFDIGRLNKLFNRRVLYIENIRELSKLQEIKKNQILDVIPKVLAMESNFDEDYKKKAVSQLTVPSNFAQSERKQKKNCLMIRLEDHFLDENNLPVLLVSMIETMKKCPEMLAKEGIFRKPGSCLEEEQIVKNLSTITQTQMLRIPETGMYCAYSIATAIKKFFQCLQMPIVSEKIYRKILSLPKNLTQEQKIEISENILQELPPQNRRVLLYFLHFIQKEVLSQKQLNKMNEQSLSVVLSPCFFKSETQSFEDLINYEKVVGILKAIIINLQFLMGNQVKLNLIKEEVKKAKEVEIVEEVRTTL